MGGVYPGAKTCKSLPGLPLKVETTMIPMSINFQKQMNNRLVLIYTGL